MGDKLIAEMNDKILEYSQVKPKKDTSTDENNSSGGDGMWSSNKGEHLIDAAVCPQDIAYPTDINLLGQARRITEKIIDKLHVRESGEKKPRTYRQKVSKEYMKVAQNRNPSRRTIRKGIKG